MTQSSRFDAIVELEKDADVGAGTRKSRVRKVKEAAPAPPPPPKDVYQKLQDGDYRTKLEYPTRDKGVPEPAASEEYRRARGAYYADQGRLEGEFKADLLAYHEVTDNPKADAAYRIAWIHGHSAGYSEVANYFSEIVELIK